MKIELNKFGEAVAFVLPDELLTRLGLEPGSELTISELPDGRLVLTPNTPQHDQILQIGRQVFEEYQETFKALAK